jgi:hypothetical protein
VTDRLYELLPAVYRIRDAEQRQPLRALFAILEHEVQAVEADIEGLYDNWFIETCDEWAVHYIGDLLEVPGLHSGGVGTFSLRAYVANVLAYRRRKGTASVLEQMAHDVSGWPARVVEFHKRLATTQHINHVRDDNLRTPDFRDTNGLELLGGPFETAAHTAEVRSVVSGRGKYNVPNIGIFLWRLQSYAMTRVTAKAVDDRRYTFDPLGRDLALFNRPRTETEISHLAEEFNVPGPLRRRPVYDELQARREALAKGETPDAVYFGKQLVFEVYQDQMPVAPEAVMICDLSGWDSPTSVANETIQVLVDPVLGRIEFPGGVPSQDVDVDYAYGFSSDVGGGPYNRSESLIGLFEDEPDIWWAGVSKTADTGLAGMYPSLAEAVGAWNGRADNISTGVIAILDSQTYTEQSETIVIGPAEQLLIVAAGWRTGHVPQAGEWNRNLNQFLVAEGLKPHLSGDISVEASGDASRLLTNGLLIEGGLTVKAGDLGGLTLTDTTLVPSEGGLVVDSSEVSAAHRNSNLSLAIDRCICGPLRVPATARSIHVIDSILDANAPPGTQAYAIVDPSESGYGPPITLERSTVFDDVRVREITLASEVIFMGRIEAERLQAGCLRYSYIPPGSHVPRRFRCQPDLALVKRARELEKPGPEDLNANERERVALSVRPVFTSTTYSDPAYAQLSIVCPEEIRTGAEDGSEMGVFNHLKQPQREANIRANLNEYLRFGMGAGIFFVN